MGPFANWNGSTARVPLHPGDLVLFYSDGVTESRRRHEEFGLDRLVATVATTGGSDAARTVQTVIAAVTSFATAAADDVAALALRMNEIE